MDRERELAAWHERWQEGRTGFHSDRINPHLEAWWPTLGVAEAAAVLVPLAGKSRDIGWLSSRGHRVVANELSPLAVAAWFEEAGIVADTRRVGPFEIWSHGLVTVLCGDFFALDPTMTGPIQAAYDRAALVALPPALRERYMEKLADLLPADAFVLLVGVDYPQAEMEGPPFSVPEAEILTLAQGRFEVSVLAAGVDMLADNPRFAEKGVSRMQEAVYRLRRLG